MNTILSDINHLPIWSQVLLIGTLLLVGNYWLTTMSTKIVELKFLQSPWWSLVKLSLWAAMLAYFAVTYWVGRSFGNGQPASWDLYARGAFIVLTVYLTTFLARYFSSSK